MSYTKWDAMADEAEEKFSKRVRDALADIIAPIVSEIEAMDEEAEYPHPWDYDRHLLAIWLEDGDDGLREYLEEDLREEAEEVARESYDSDPCCSEFSCPCGG